MSRDEFSELVLSHLKRWLRLSRTAMGLRRARAEWSCALERDDLEVRARAEVVAAAAELLAARDAVLAAREAAAALERAHRLHVARYEEGVGTAFDVLEAQRALAAARVELAETILRYDGAQLELLVAAGRAPLQAGERARVGRGQ